MRVKSDIPVRSPFTVSTKIGQSHMNSHLEPENIDVNTPPPSPVSFADDSLDSFDAQEVVSPAKRAKTAGVGRRSKRRKKDNVPIVEQVQNEFVEDAYDSSSEPPPLDGGLTGGYAGYVVAAAAQFAGFYPLSQDLYVVQAWDNKLSCTKVGLWFLLIVYQNSPRPSTPGTTCNTWRLGMMYTSRVLAPKVTEPRRAFTSNTSENTIRRLSKTIHCLHPTTSVRLLHIP